MTTGSHFGVDDPDLDWRLNNDDDDDLGDEEQEQNRTQPSGLVVNSLSPWRRNENAHDGKKRARAA